MISKTQEISFQNHDGHSLAAKIEFPPDRKPFAFAIFTHCFACNGNLTAAINISRALAAQGIAVMRFDFSGMSEGAPVKPGFSTNITDLLAAAAFLKENFSEPSLLIGHSLGGTAALFAASSIPSVEGVVTIGSPADPKQVKKLVKESIEEIRKKGEAQVTIGGRAFKVGQDFVEELVQKDISQSLKKMRKALLVMHAPFDKIVGIENAKWIYEHAIHPKSFISLDNADHILSKTEDSNYVGEVVAAWASRYLPDHSSKTLQSDLEVVVNLDPEHKYTTLIKAGTHYLTADEPESVGGDDFGPSPYQLLSSALGACTAMTLKMYSDRKKWNLGEVRVHLHHDKVYTEDQNETLQDGEKKRKIDVITRQLELSSELTPTQRERLLEIANRCPVHRTLEKSIRIDTGMLEVDTPDQ
ncbi:MAG: alpha/beta fold hydrolase [Saprospiraceae bacterium]|nr:alpha/beta fold hydrolase [Saprospiraceae bacterium]